jgi:hypothetical protein
MKTRVMMTTTGKAFLGTRPVASLHRRRTAEDATETTVTNAKSSMPEMHIDESKAGAEISSVKSKNSVMKGTMVIMVLTMTNPARIGHQKQDTSQQVLRHIP